MHIIIDQWVSKLNLHTYTENDSRYTQVEDTRQSVRYPGKSQAYEHIAESNHDSAAKQVVEVASSNAHQSLCNQLE